MFNAPLCRQSSKRYVLYFLREVGDPDQPNRQSRWGKSQPLGQIPQPGMSKAGSGWHPWLILPSFGSLVLRDGYLPRSRVLSSDTALLVNFLQTEMCAGRSASVVGKKRKTALQKVAVVLVALTLGSCASRRGEKPVTADAALREDFRLIQDQRIYFGHQSVGSNIVEGLQDLAASSGGRFKATPFAGENLPPGGIFAESLIGSNGQPDTKCDAFSQNIARLAPASLDIALMKFCYIDFDRNTDVGKLFGYYQKTADRLKAAYPRTTFVHVTVPLTARSDSWKRAAKALLGREDLGDIANLRRSEFNQLLLTARAGEPIFDLAKVESTFMDGRRNAFRGGKQTGYALVRDYTVDGGHLNAVGRKLAARELVRTLAAVVRGRVSARLAHSGDQR
jgi:hypothetical protein